MISVGKNQYKVLDTAVKTVAFVKTTNTKQTNLTIPGTIKDSSTGITLKVTQIQANAFKNCRKLKSVTIGKNVTTIQKNSFYGCRKLAKVTFKGTSVKTVKSGAFKKTASKMTVKVPKNLKKNKKKVTAFKKKLIKSGMNKNLKLK